MTLQREEIFQAHVDLFGTLTDFAKFQITSIWMCKGFLNCQSPEEAAKIAHRQESLEPVSDVGVNLHQLTNHSHNENCYMAVCLLAFYSCS
ncbi:hypothetical protein NIES4074_60710 (plasmid) [Cylindrospermum sp. NIES-4074]|nr:hypothetical protein NIES4074_60710 [Cylindrospermum sp. NIES-4074]